MNPTPITHTARPFFRGRAMRVLRLLSLAGGVFGILLPAALLASTAHGIPDAAEPYVCLLGLALASTGFFLVAMAGHRMSRSPTLRSFAALMLLVPFGASAIVIWHGDNLMMVFICAYLLVLTILLYLSFIHPLMVVPTPRKTPRRPHPLAKPLRSRRYSQPASRAIR